MLLLFFSVVCFFCTQIHANFVEIKPKSIFLEKIPSLLQNEKWDEVTRLGEQILEENGLKAEERFQILDQLVSSYFRLGLFEQARDRASALLDLGYSLENPYYLIDSLYKLSAALRGRADSETNLDSRREFFSESYKAIEMALALCEEKCPDNKSLRARVLFNKGAVHCDDPEGNIQMGIEYYKEAIILFTELQESDFVHRMTIRLGKAYLLLGQTAQTREIIAGLYEDLSNIEKRTYMHLLYLESQVCLAERDRGQATIIATKGREIADGLHAIHDSHRFEEIIRKARAVCVDKI